MSRAPLRLALLLPALWLLAVAPQEMQAAADRAEARNTNRADARSPDEAKADNLDAEMIDPLGPNAACYVCHMTFVHEEMSVVHKAEQVTCIKCHGLSAAHANDEHIGATPPEVSYPREKIDAACAECHEDHDVPASKVLARFFERKLPPDAAPVCTDCHGRHRIPEAARADESARRPLAEGPALRE